MRAAFITGTGPPDAIRVGELPVPAAGPADVLVTVDTVAVNQVDTYIRSGRYPVPMQYPFVVGRDLAGTVAAAQPESGFTPGQRVWCNSLGHGGRQGSFSGYAVVPAVRLYPLPAAAEPQTAVAAFHPAATAFVALHHRVHVRAGDTMVIGGAAGSIGSCALSFAKEAGLRVIATARPGDHDLCRRLGADAVLDFTSPALAGCGGCDKPAAGGTRVRGPGRGDPPAQRDCQGARPGGIGTGARPCRRDRARVTGSGPRHPAG